MGDFLKAAYRVLSEAATSMHPQDIVLVAKREGILVSKGKTPGQTMKSKLSTDILRKRDKSLFIRTEAGHFGLRAWLDTKHSREYPHPAIDSSVKEYHAPRYKKSLLSEDILAFDRNLLKNHIDYAGSIAHGRNLRNLFNICQPVERAEAERNKSIIQLVSLFVVRYRHHYITYKRSKRLPENRLHGTYSIGFGGHLNPGDIPVLLQIENDSDAVTYLRRELSEELILEDPLRFQYIGLLYDDSRDVSTQHLGILYLVDIANHNFEIGERGFLIDAKLENLQTIQARHLDFENWSQIIIRYLVDSHD
ncbi:MAG: hypothetical protein HY804_07245 [Nitrospinae bacterium]|nr:hypothetical protein [Nitrospinota bacterium]